MNDFTLDLNARLALYSIDAVADMIIWTDRDGWYVSVNRAAQQLLGYSADEFKGRRVSDVDPFFNEARWRAHWADLERLTSVTLETVNVGKDGRWIPIEVRATLVAFDGMSFNCSIVRDISERRRGEEEREALNQHIYQLSITDDLTGLGNRRRFDETLAGTLKRQARSGEPVSVILIDIDHFKKFNDHYGHLRGDDCLRRIATAIASQVPTGHAARFGGEEFACVLTGVDLVGTVAVAERLRRAIEGLAIVHAPLVSGPVTASLGAVCCERPMVHTPESLVAAADALLYRAKHDGRNRAAAARL